MSNSHNLHDAARPTATDSQQLHYHQQQEQPGLEVDSRADTAGLHLHRDVEAEDTTKQAVEPGANGGYFPDEHYAAPGLQAAPAPAYLTTSDGKYENGRGLHPATATAGGGGGGGATYPAEAEATAPIPGTKKPNRRRLWIILGVIAAILIIIGAVLGGVLGSRAASSSSSDPSSQASGDGDGDTAAGNSGNDTAPPSAPLQYIRPGSSLAATGWRDGPDFHIRLFYQGPDQLLRYSNFSSKEDGGWGARRPVLLDQMEYKAAVNTSLAAATSVESREIVRFRYFHFQLRLLSTALKGEDKLFYLDTTNTIRLQLFRPDVRAAGNGGQLNKYPVKAAPGSRLGAYWPSLLSQDEGVGGRLRWTRYWGVNQQNKPFWEDQDANVTASAGSGLVVVPASSKYGNSGGFLFRRGMGSCDLTKNLNGLTIPDDSPLAAFTVARSGDNPQNFVNTYILYVGPKGAVNMVWQDDENSGWKGPVQYPEAFGGADAGTDIACVTPAAWAGSNF
ncbi:hypothetical protein PG997_002541, partial [Apiospora hydei]